MILYKTNEIADKFALAGDKFMSENNQDLLIMLVEHSQKTNKEYKN